MQGFSNCLGLFQVIMANPEQWFPQQQMGQKPNSSLTQEADRLKRELEEMRLQVGSTTGGKVVSFCDVSGEVTIFHGDFLVWENFFTMALGTWRRENCDVFESLGWGFSLTKFVYCKAKWIHREMGVSNLSWFWRHLASFPSLRLKKNPWKTPKSGAEQTWDKTDTPLLQDDVFISILHSRSQALSQQNTLAVELAELQQGQRQLEVTCNLVNFWWVGKPWSCCCCFVFFWGGREDFVVGFTFEERWETKGWKVEGENPF